MWLNRIIARRGIADFHRDREDDPGVGPLPTENLGEDEVWGEEPSESDEAGRVVVQSVIDECLEGLCESHRDVIEFNVFQDLPAKDTADRVNENHPDLETADVGPERAQDRQPLSRLRDGQASRPRLTMADDVKKLLSDYIAEHRAGGEADPIAYHRARRRAPTAPSSPS